APMTQSVTVALLPVLARASILEVGFRATEGAGRLDVSGRSVLSEFAYCPCTQIGRDAMSQIMRAKIVLVALVMAGAMSMRTTSAQQPTVAPVNDVPNPYQTVLNWAQLPEGRKWGSTAGVDIGPDGRVWAINRCDGGGSSCDTA